MNSYFAYIAIVLAWIFSFVEPSGWASSVHLTDKLNGILILLSILFFFNRPFRRQKISRGLVWWLVVTFAFIPYLISHTFDGVSYLASFLVVYLFSQLKITPKVVMYSGVTVAILGLFILLVYTRGEVLSGWNDNAISMLGLFSYIYFTIFLLLKRRTKVFWKWSIVSLIYLLLLFSLDCRSGMLFSSLAFAAIYWYRISIKILLNKKKCLLLLNFPLILAFGIIVFSYSSYFESLNLWSYAKFEKPIFNGREELWDISLMLLKKSYYLGTGKFLLNYHNSGIAALSVFGILGYICWILYFKRILHQFRLYLFDPIVFGCMLAFIFIFLQQSVDLGFISPAPNRIPYMILGCGLGRIFLIDNNRIR